MQVADEESYEEMIRALQNFLSQVSTQCQVMSDAGTDCVDNTENDPAATKAAAKLQSCIGKIRGTFGDIQGIVAGLQKQLNDIREAAQAANNIGD